MSPSVIARNEAIPDCAGRICLVNLPIGDCFAPRNDVSYMFLLDKQKSRPKGGFSFKNNLSGFLISLNNNMRSYRMLIKAFLSTCCCFSRMV